MITDVGPGRFRLHASAGGAGIEADHAEFPSLWQQHDEGDPLTRFVADFSTSFLAANMPLAKTFLFIRLVCAWGGLRGKNPERLYLANRNDGFATLRNQLADARQLSLDGKPEPAMEALDGIKGARISFRSKFLRFLCPDHAAVLDSKVRKHLGYPETPRGYAEFVQDCQTIRDHLKTAGPAKPDNTAWLTTDVEMAIFMKLPRP